MLILHYDVLCTKVQFQSLTYHQTKNTCQDQVLCHLKYLISCPKLEFTEFFVFKTRRVLVKVSCRREGFGKSKQTKPPTKIQNPDF